MAKKYFTIDFKPEICCDICWEVIHNHFHCPACGDNDAGSSIYHEVDFEGWNENSFECEECDTVFEYVGKKNGIMEFKIKEKGGD